MRLIETARDQGAIDLRGADPLTIFDADHVGLGTPYIEPNREADAAIKQVQAGFKSKAQIILEQGGNPREVQKQIGREREKDNEDGLVFSSDFANESSNVDSGDDTTSSNENDVDNDNAAADDDSTNGESADRFVAGRKYSGPDGELYEYTDDGFRKVNVA